MKLKNLIVALPLIVSAYTSCAYTNSLALLSPRTVSCAWDASPDPKAVGYRLYAFNADPTTNNIAPVITIDTTNCVSAVTNLTAGVQYWFFVTAFDLSNYESDPSNLITYHLIPAPTSVHIVIK